MIEFNNTQHYSPTGIGIHNNSCKIKLKSCRDVWGAEYMLPQKASPRYTVYVRSYATNSFHNSNFPLVPCFLLYEPLAEFPQLSSKFRILRQRTRFFPFGYRNEIISPMMVHQRRLADIHLSRIQRTPPTSYFSLQFPVKQRHTEE